MGQIRWKMYIQCVPKKAAPYVKYSNTHNTEQKSLKITENTLTSFEHCVLNCK